MISARSASQLVTSSAVGCFGSFNTATVLEVHACSWAKPGKCSTVAETHSRSEQQPSTVGVYEYTRKSYCSNILLYKLLLYCYRSIKYENIITRSPPPTPQRSLRGRFLNASWDPEQGTGFRVLDLMRVLQVLPLFLKGSFNPVYLTRL